MIPPVANQFDTATGSELLTLPSFNASTISNAIKYTFEEVNGERLPSFALEQNMSKSRTLTTNTAADTSIDTESHNFVRIARGNRVTTLTMTANENEEVKMTLI